MKDEDPVLVYGVYSKLVEGIKHFDSIQTTYRTLASTLLLSCFVAIGFLFSTKATSLPIDRAVGSVIVAIMGIGIVTIIFCVDLLFQERLLIANFVEAVKLERQHAWLPRAHMRIMGKGNHAGSPNRKVFFYIGCGGCLFLIIAVSVLSIFRFELNLVSGALVSLVIGTIFGYSFILRKAAGKFEILVRKSLHS
jgi:hypothetical protein